MAKIRPNGSTVGKFTAGIQISAFLNGRENYPALSKITPSSYCQSFGQLKAIASRISTRAVEKSSGHMRDNWKFLAINRRLSQSWPPCFSIAHPAVIVCP